jgi:hypothetical protein
MAFGHSWALGILVDGDVEYAKRRRSVWYKLSDYQLMHMPVAIFPFCCMSCCSTKALKAEKVFLSCQQSLYPVITLFCLATSNLL